jgi:hypothetical protein
VGRWQQQVVLLIEEMPRVEARVDGQAEGGEIEYRRDVQVA